MLRGLLNHFDRHERQLVFRSAVVGAIVWLIVFTLKTAVHEVEHATLHFLEEASLNIVWLYLLSFLLVGALIVATISRFGSTIIHYQDDDGHIHELIDVEGDGLERAISLYYASEPTFEQTLTGAGEAGVDVRWKMPSFSLALRKFVATLATLGSGGSGGLEASVTLIGESVAAGIFKPRLRREGWLAKRFDWMGPSDPDDLQTAQLSGIAAAVATLLGAPFTAAFFATEVMYRRRPIIEKLVYSLVSALVAFFLNATAPALLNQTALAQQFGIHFENKPIFHIEEITRPDIANWRYILLICMMCVVISLVSIQFAKLRKLVDGWFHHYQQNVYLRHFSGAIITGVIALLVLFGLTLAAQNNLFGIGESEAKHALSLVLGTGETVIDSALSGELLLAVAVIALVARILAVLSTIGSGGSAGLLVPSLFFGTMIATVFVQGPELIGLSDFSFQADHIIIPAMVSSLVAIVNVPLAAILFATEAFGGVWMVPAIVAMVVSNIFAYNTSIYRTQREQYETRQILPGYSIHRLPVPAKWETETLASLDMRRNYDVNVIGWLEYEAADGLPHVRLSADANLPLNRGDILVVLGKDEDLKRLEQVAEGIEPFSPPSQIAAEPEIIPEPQPEPETAKDDGTFEEIMAEVDGVEGSESQVTDADPIGADLEKAEGDDEKSE